jgi:RNA polymerase sigma-70 factor (ECF subfamily)
MPSKRKKAEDIVRLQMGYVHGLALKYAPVPGLAEDVSQQVFTEFVAKFDTWDLESDLRPLFADMVRKVSRRCWQERSRKLSKEFRALTGHIRALAETEPDEAAGYSDKERKALRACLEKLPEKSRKLVEAHYYLQVTSAEMGERMRMSAEAVRQALVRIRSRLRKCVRAALG